MVSTAINVKHDLICSHFTDQFLLVDPGSALKVASIGSLGRSVRIDFVDLIVLWLLEDCSGHGERYLRRIISGRQGCNQRTEGRARVHENRERGGKPR